VLQRAKDHAGLDQPLSVRAAHAVLGLLIAPLTSLPVLAAKHCWLIVNLALLPAVAGCCAGSRPAVRRIALIGLLAVVPLRTNFQFGQQHVFVLFLFALATWCYFPRASFHAGALLALAAAFSFIRAVRVAARPQAALARAGRHARRRRPDRVAGIALFASSPGAPTR
jgi:hypothetical protein